MWSTKIEPRGYEPPKQTYNKQLNWSSKPGASGTCL
jgi:hypothetical protein